MAIPIVSSGVSGGGTVGILPVWSSGTSLADSKIQDGIATGILTVAKNGVTARTATFPDAAVQVAGSASALTTSRIPKGTATAGVVQDSQIADGVSGNVLTIAGTLTAPRTATVPDKSGTLAMTSDLVSGFSWNRTLQEFSGPAAQIGGYTWTARTASTSATWNSIAYGNGTFVAVAQATTSAATSPDGVTWTPRTMPSAANWIAVAYGNGMFTAVSFSTSSAATSPDGITWTARTMPSAAAWSGVCYGNGLFVAVVAGTAVSATSPDGITWTARTMPSSATWQSVCYGNGLFVAVADGPSTASASSPDGITWTARTLSSSGKWQSVCYGNGLFVTLDVGPGTVASTSPDGVNWTARTLPASTSWNKVCYGNGIFVATGSTTNAATSPDGITWTARTMPSSATWYALTFGNGVFTALNGAVGASCGGALTFAGDFTASRTHIVQDATGTVPLLEVAQSWTLTQRFNAAEAVTCGMAAVAGNGLVQLASGTTKANGVAFGTDTFIFRLSAGYLSLQTSGVGATDRHGVSFVRGGYSAPGAHLSDSNGDKVVLYNGDNQHSVIGVGTSGDTWFKGTNGGTGGQFDFYLGTSTALKVFTIDSFGNLLGDATNGGDLKIQRAGKGLYVKEGTNATMGTGTLVAGAVVISTTKITATSRVFLTSQVDGGTVGFLRVSARTAATSFTITSSSGTDTSTVAWIIMEPA